jgi:hypothetical protein
MKASFSIQYLKNSLVRSGSSIPASDALSATDNDQAISSAVNRLMHPISTPTHASADTASAATPPAWLKLKNGRKLA